MFSGCVALASGSGVCSCTDVMLMMRPPALVSTSDEPQFASIKMRHRINGKNLAPLIESHIKKRRFVIAPALFTSTSIRPSR